MLTEAQKATFYQQLGEHGNPFSNNALYRESILREWYRKGQRMFRTCLEDPIHSQFEMVDTFEWLTSQIDDDVEKEGFMMGWQSDAWAYDNRRPFSVEGGTRIVLEDNDEPIEAAEGDRLLDGSSEFGSASED